MSALAPHQQRVVDEKQELDVKRTALERFLGGSFFPMLPAEEQHRLHAQSDAMKVYSEILGMRIAAF